MRFFIESFNILQEEGFGCLRVVLKQAVVAGAAEERPPRPAVFELYAPYDQREYLLTAMRRRALFDVNITETFEVIP